MIQDDRSCGVPILSSEFWRDVFVRGNRDSVKAVFRAYVALQEARMQDVPAARHFEGQYTVGLRERRICFAGDRLYLRRFDIDGWMPGDPASDRPYHVYLHNILLHDEDEAPHSHPWEWAESLILAGGYVEQRKAFDPCGGATLRNEVRRPGTVGSLNATEYHRIIDVLPGTWTLFVTGPRVKSWGFDVPGRGHVEWRDRLSERGITPAY